jgi:CheY-like chemotaxis protein
VTGQSCDLSRLRALVAEDNEHMRVLLRALLAAVEIRNIRDFRNGEEALAAMRTFEPDFVITDLSMAKMDGIAFTRAVRARPARKLNTVPILMITGHTQKNRIEAARDAGINELLVKPVAPAALYQRIDEIILRPRAFVRSPSYYGPDRRRQAKPDYRGPWRRESDREAMKDAVFL